MSYPIELQLLLRYPPSCGPQERDMHHSLHALPVLSKLDLGEIRYSTCGEEEHVSVAGRLCYCAGGSYFGSQTAVQAPKLHGYHQASASDISDGELLRQGNNPLQGITAILHCIRLQQGDGDI